MLNLSHNQITTLQHFNVMMHIKMLNLSDNQISILKYVKGISHIQTLNLRNNQIIRIKFLKNYHELWFKIKTFYPDEEDATAFKGPNILKVNLDGNKIYPCMGLEDLPRKCKKIVSSSASKPELYGGFNSFVD
ncbi:uncharacterized protein ASCRUDRAFT_7842 [Ascoidea rubescens DSM 1968]|uniref:Outer arm dynein light chain 1 n=1 Tax=Ascoidea rubescens DSM 1968 TaxID=1344418 RepID=A0A1D2VJ25_9ASCO|nr:hypothetical protein ASCRUDRAFT_7842 [Ascoidea rubescens DSM 1968]ODV61636.1 hypothetical protein ASCRUDRAFT_7842 [Ascoidea rubescens DSM 1968]